MCDESADKRPGLEHHWMQSIVVRNTYMRLESYGTSMRTEMAVIEGDWVFFFCFKHTKKLRYKENDESYTGVPNNTEQAHPVLCD